MRTKIRVLIAGTVVLGACSGDDATQAERQQSVVGTRFQRVAQPGPLTTKFVPRALDQTPVTVVAVLEGESVADVQEAQARKLTRAEKDTVKAQRRAEQAGPRASIEAAGGRVIGSFQSALNGIKVRIPRNQVDSLRRIPGVVDVKRVVTYTHENFVGAQRIQAPGAWSGVAGAAGFRGEGIKVAIIDTGVDYTHANFGGPGTVEAFDAAFATSTQPADPALFGPDAPKVKGGIDLVGDDYDGSNTPAPDANPLDCNGHGSHVAGSTAGFGVTIDGKTYRGSYDQLTHAANPFSIGPGVAPLAEIFAVRVFGCNGSTDVVTEALEWAVDNDMDVVNMSLGSAFGTVDDDSAVASDNAVRAGVTVVASAGNDGDIRYITGSPASSTKTISVAATATPGFLRSANLALPAVDGDAARTVVALNANGAEFRAGSLTAVVLRNGAQVSLGCNLADYAGTDVAGKVVIVARGVCARVAKAINGQKAGAAAVVMVNNTPALPPLEGQITSNPDNGESFLVTIPFFGVRGPVTTASSDGALIALRDGASIAVSEGEATKTGTAGFSSRGARIGDALLKPDVGAPGELLVSTLVGSGSGSLTISGTSMASPHVAGVAALTIQAHPRWRPEAIKSAIVNSGNPEELADYSTSRVGSGLVNAAAAAGTQAYAFANRDTTTLNFGLEEFRGDLREHRLVHVRNDASTAVTFDVGVERQQGSPHQLTSNVRRLTVPARSERAILVTLEVPAATAGNSDDFREVAGLITFTPATASGNRGIGLRVPYYLVPRVSANVSTRVSRLTGATPTGTAIVSNFFASIPSTADFYALGLESPNDRLGAIDLRAAGVQSIDVPDDKILVFAINTFRGWSTPSGQEFDVQIDTNADGSPDFLVVGIDLGLVTVGDFTGQMASLIVDLATGAQSIDFLAVAPTDASTILLPVLASSIGLKADNPRLTYTVASFDLLGPDSDAFTGQAGFNAFTSAISTGQFVSVPANQIVGVPVSVDRTEFALTPASGLMVVTQDNRNGTGEADLVRVRF